MQLSSGARLGPYEIVGQIGAGGMGEVYRARDTALRREVALKVLPPLFAADPDRRARFAREAQLLATLNHPNIAAIYGLEKSGDASALVLELVEGPTLAERIATGPLRFDDALHIATQVADALEAAHEKGIVHRDLKPANIKLRPDGTVKVLDFGLAKALRDEVSADVSASPTLTAMPSRLGVIVGTAAYMSPEQAKGRPIDKRADVWAFGCVLFEMLTARRAFDGEDVADAVVAVMSKEPDWSLLPPTTPPRLIELLKRCLRKNSRERLRDIGDVRIQLEDASLPTAVTAGVAGTGVQPARGLGRGLTIAVAIVAGAILGGVIAASVAVWRAPAAPSRAEIVNLVPLTAALGVESEASWSPDERAIAYESNQWGNWEVWVLRLGTAQPVNRTLDMRADDRFPRWSPDGGELVFWSNREGAGAYFRVSPLGGTPRRVPGSGPVPATPAAWAPDGSEIACPKFENGEWKIDLISLATGASRQLPLAGSASTRYHLSWSPDGKWLVYIIAGGGTPSTSEMRLLRLSDGHSLTVTNGRTADWSPSWSPDARLLYFVSNRGGTMDLWRLRVGDAGPDGSPQRITTGLQMRYAAVSPRGTKVVYSKGQPIAVSNIWRVPLRLDRPSTFADAQQLTFDEAYIEFIDVSPGGQTVVFSSNRTGTDHLWIMPAAGGEPLQLTSAEAPDWAPRWSHDGKQIVFYSMRSGNRDIWVVPADGGAARKVTSSPESDYQPVWSADDSEIAWYTPVPGTVWKVSAQGGVPQKVASPGTLPVWSADGGSILFTAGVTTPDARSTLQIWRAPVGGGDPQRITTSPEQSSLPWVSRDGRMLLYRAVRYGVAGFSAMVAGQPNEVRLADLTRPRGALGANALSPTGSLSTSSGRSPPETSGSRTSSNRSSHETIAVPQSSTA
jgi:eukaryotic-like serine/threonine-protein kinase